MSRRITFKTAQERKWSSDNCAGPHLTPGWALWKTLTLMLKTSVEILTSKR